MIRIAEIREGFQTLGVLGKCVAFHTSFKSFGNVQGGIDAYLSFLCENFETILVPAFTWESTIHPPQEDRPLQNGMDYSIRWQSPQKPFRLETASIDPKMGIVPKRIAGLAHAQRSNHPWHSWVAWGKDAEVLTNPHPWKTTNLPLERLAIKGGYVALVGVSLKYCTAMHIAEERAGRRPFIRWVLDHHGIIRRIRVGGCANWFESMQPRLQHLFHTTVVGHSLIQVAALEPLIETASRLIRNEPLLASCSPSCIKCQDALKGGPLP